MTDSRTHGAIQRFLPLVALCIWLGSPTVLRADFLDVWLEAPAKGRLVIVQQVPDLSRGFDSFYVVELDTKNLKILQTSSLAESERKASSATGHFEVYVAARDRARRKLERAWLKSGYAVPAELWSNNPVGMRTLVLESGELRLVLSVASAKGGPMLTLGLPGKSEIQLQFTELITSGGGQATSIAVSFRHVLVARRGRVLVVVVREMPVPSPDQFPRDRLLIVPLGDALKTLGVEGPLKNARISIP